MGTEGRVGTIYECIIRDGDEREEGGRGEVVVKKKGARRVKCKWPSKVHLRGCFRRECYSARRTARDFGGTLQPRAYFISLVNGSEIISAE